MVVVAQLVEPRIVIPVVAGSSPVDHPILKFSIQNAVNCIQNTDQFTVNCGLKVDQY